MFITKCVGTYFNNFRSFPKQVALKEIRNRSRKVILCPPQTYMEKYECEKKNATCLSNHLTGNWN